MSHSDTTTDANNIHFNIWLNKLVETYDYCTENALADYSSSSSNQTSINLTTFSIPDSVQSLSSKVTELICHAQHFYPTHFRLDTRAPKEYLANLGLPIMHGSPSNEWNFRSVFLALAFLVTTFTRIMVHIYLLNSPTSLGINAPLTYLLVFYQMHRFYFFLHFTMNAALALKFVYVL